MSAWTWQLGDSDSDSDSDKDDTFSMYSQNLPLSRALQVIERDGNVAACHSFCCCTPCAIDELESMGVPERHDGYCFYTCQDAEDAADCGQLRLAVGSFEDDGHDRVAEMIMARLREEGLTTEWSGNAIHVHLSPVDHAAMRRLVFGPLAEAHRLKANRFWRAFKEAVHRSRQEKHVIGASFIAWACLPDGPVFKRARADFASGLSPANC